MLKLGGSVVTWKGRPLAFNREAASRLAKEIRSSRVDRLVIVHGGGSFGHHVALGYGLDRYAGSGRIVYRGLIETHMAMRLLSRRLIDVFLEEGLPVYPFASSSLTVADRGEVYSIYLDPIREALRRGFIPMVHGDVVFDRTGGFAILSGDKLASKLGLKLGASRVVFALDVDGVYDRDPRADGAKLLRRLNVEEAKVLKGRLPRASDATGGMKSKLAEAVFLAEHGVKVCFVNGLKPRRVFKALRGLDFEGTVVDGGVRS